MVMFWRHVELAGEVPAGLIHEQHGVGAGRDRERDLGEVEVHRLGVAERQDQAGCLALRSGRSRRRCRPTSSADRAAPRARSPLCPPPCDLVLLPDPGLVREPDFYRRAAREGLPRTLSSCGGEAPPLKASIALRSCA